MCLCNDLLDASPTPSSSFPSHPRIIYWQRDLPRGSKTINAIVYFKGFVGPNTLTSGVCSLAVKRSSVYGEMLRALSVEYLDLHLVPMVQIIVADVEKRIHDSLLFYLLVSLSTSPASREIII